MINELTSRELDAGCETRLALLPLFVPVIVVSFLDRLAWIPAFVLTATLGHRDFMDEQC